MPCQCQSLACTAVQQCRSVPPYGHALSAQCRPSGPALQCFHTVQLALCVSWDAASCVVWRHKTNASQSNAKQRTQGKQRSKYNTVPVITYQLQPTSKRPHAHSSQLSTTPAASLVCSGWAVGGRVNHGRGRVRRDWEWVCIHTPAQLQCKLYGVI